MDGGFGVANKTTGVWEWFAAALIDALGKERDA